MVFGVRINKSIMLEIADEQLARALAKAVDENKVVVNIKRSKSDGVPKKQEKKL